jgi:hypothetical protein
MRISPNVIITLALLFTKKEERNNNTQSHITTTTKIEIKEKKIHSHTFD